MFDYTPEGIGMTQGDLTVTYLNLIDKKLEKLNKRVRTLTFIVAAAVIFKNKKEIINKIEKLKGE